ERRVGGGQGGQVEGARDRLDVPVDLQLGERLVERRDQHEGVGAGGLGGAGQLHRVAGGQGPGVRDHRNPARGVLHHDLEDVSTFGGGQRGVLARPATDDECVDPGVDVAVDNLPQQAGVDLVVGGERGGKCGQYAAEFFGHVGLLCVCVGVCGGLGSSVRGCGSAVRWLARLPLPARR